MCFAQVRCFHGLTTFSSLLSVKVVQIKKMSKKQCSKVLFTWWNVYSWMVGSFIHTIFPTLSPAYHQLKSVFHLNHMRKWNLGTKSCIIITLNLILAINKHLKLKYKKITLIRYELINVFWHRNYKPETHILILKTLLLIAIALSTKNIQKQLLAIVRRRIFVWDI